MERVDAHQHFWKLSRGDYGWLTPSRGILYRDHLPEALWPSMQAGGVDRCVCVQAAPTVAETDFLLDLADRHDWIAGVVGWIDLDSPACLADYARLRTHGRFVGVRPMIQDLDPSWLLRPRVLDHLSVLARDGFPVDLQACTWHLPVLRRLLERHAGLRAVIDHAARPRIADRMLDPWRRDMEALAAFPNITCKLSGLITEAPSRGRTHDDFRPYVEHVVQAFGPRRVMFGSDWPVCLTAGTYADVLDLVRHALPRGLSPDDLDWIYGQAAVQFYALS